MNEIIKGTIGLVILYIGLSAFADRFIKKEPVITIPIQQYQQPSIRFSTNLDL